MYCVDLPGYGFAKVSKQTQEKWGRMIENYLHKSKVLKAVFLLIDIRHEPSANDANMYQWILANGYSPIIIATKLDKIRIAVDFNVSVAEKTIWFFFLPPLN